MLHMNEWEIKPNGIRNAFGYDVYFTDKRAFPFYATCNYGVICGENGSSHARPIDGDDRLALATLKVIKLQKEIPDFMEEYFPSLDLSQYKTNIDKAKACANVIVNDIYCDGRCFDLRDSHSEVVFTFWQPISETDKEEIISSICQEKNFDRDCACIAALPNNYSPDEISVDGKVYGYRDEHATPFIVYDTPTNENEYRIMYGKYSTIHSLLRSEVEKNMKTQLMAKGLDFAEASRKVNSFRTKHLVTEGRYWDLSEKIGKIVFSFWSDEGGKRTDKTQIIKQICNTRGLDFDKAYVSVLGQIIKVTDYDNMMNFKPTDDDYAQNPFNDDYNKEKEELDRLRAIHLMGQEEKREALSDFRDTKVAAYDDKHLKYDKPQNGYDYMTDAEYRFRTSMDESKSNKKLIISENQLKNIKNKTINHDIK